MKRLLNVMVIFVITLPLIISGCTGRGSTGKSLIVVGSKIDTEGALLSQLVGSALQL